MENLPGRGFGVTCCACVSFAWEIVRDSPMVNFGCVRLGNPDLDFQNLDFGFPIEREIRKRISTLRYLFLHFHFYRSIGKSAKGFEKLFLRTAGLARGRLISKKKTAVH